MIIKEAPLPKSPESAGLSAELHFRRESCTAWDMQPWSNHGDFSPRTIGLGAVSKRWIPTTFDEDESGHSQKLRHIGYL